MVFRTSYRHPGPELMDNPHVPVADLIRNLQELETVNALLGGYNTTIKGLSKLLTDTERTYSIIDFGCGGGDTLVAIHQWSQKKGFKTRLTGLDISATAIDFARKRCCEVEGANFVHSSFQDFSGKEEYDIAICSLFCHHFYGEDLDLLIRKMMDVSKVGIVINDLHRHWLAWGSIKLLTRFFSKSYLVKNDAPLSVARGFVKREWEQQVRSLDVRTYTIRWEWAFRYLVVLCK